MTLDDPVIITCAVSGARRRRAGTPGRSARTYTIRRLHLSFVMGVLGGVPATARDVAAVADNLPPGAPAATGGVPA